MLKATNANYPELDRKISELLNLDDNCIFVLTHDRKSNILEYIYPAKLNGNIVPVSKKNLVGTAFIMRAPYFSNDIQSETSLKTLDWLLKMNGDPIKKMLVFTIPDSDSPSTVLQIVRRGQNKASAGPDFNSANLNDVIDLLNEFDEIQLAAESD